MLPGLRFDPQARVLGEALPRMDIAAFVGFAERGPLHLPVALEDEDAFARIFGGSPLLAREKGTGRPVSGHLANAVRAFFANGGRRCWVVRVAGESASANRFRLRGWRQVARRAGSWQPGGEPVAVARCEGSWSDQLRLTPLPRTRPVSLVGPARLRNGGGIALSLKASPPPVAGDLLCIDAGDGSAQSWLPASRVTRLDDGSTVVECDAGLQRDAAGALSGDVALTDLTLARRARIVSLDLEVSDARDGSVKRLEGLGLVRGHPSDWRLLGSDDALYAPGARPSALAALRFPLAAGSDGGDAADGMELPWSAEELLPADAEPGTASALVRDGLAEFSAALFLDTDLADIERSRLLERADELRYTGSARRALRGLHALLGDVGSAVQDEITLLAVPDAMLQPWRVVNDGSAGPPLVVLPLPQTPAPAAHTFTDCQPNGLPPLAWDLGQCRFTDQTLDLAWQPAAAAPGLRYLLQAGDDTGFAAPDTVQWLAQPGATLLGRWDRARYMRVRAEADGGVGPWSAVLSASAPQRALVEIDGQAVATALWPVHAALLRLAAARGDLFALLALPASWREDDALQHARRLQALDADAYAPSTGSFGACYHPWTLAADGSQGLIAVPPDGLAAALLARRASERGAWVAPANEPLRGVVALTPPLQATRLEELDDGRINVLRREPAAFVVLSENTLASEDELLPIHARRLLSLLRRLAQRLSAEFVFEPNTPALCVAMQTRCEHAMQRLYRRGAFAGARAADAFQVNVLPGADEATVVVELRVRPAAALHFITVRLAQAGTTSAVTEIL